jgi:23S rRNA (uracil1939-C5)-methyltransferase
VTGLAHPDARTAGARGPARTPAKPRPGDELELAIDRVDSRGRPGGRARHATGEYAVVLRRGVPGSRVRARVLRRRGERIEARAVALIDPGPNAATPRCRHFGVCGGCSFQDVAYAAQLELKREAVRRALEARGVELEVEPCRPASDPWHYRNKMELTFGRRFVEPGELAGVPAEFALGLHPAEHFHKVLDLGECPIQSDAMGAVARTARRLALERGLEAWDTRAHAGLLRHLVLRQSAATGELLVVLVTSAEAPERVRPFAAELCAAHPEIAALVQAVNARHGQTAVGQRELVLHGPGHIVERVAGLELRLSARSFFQTNTRGAEELVAIVREEARCAPGDAVLDLYCGGGLFALALARAAGSVRGLELVEAAVEDARANAERNAIANASFTAGDVAALLAGRGAEPPPDVVVVDPPRAGLHPSVPRALAELRPRRLVYVACNPAAAAADLRVLADAGLAPRRARPLDLFPHTPHVECVFTLERSSRWTERTMGTGRERSAGGVRCRLPMTAGSAACARAVRTCGRSPRSAARCSSCASSRAATRAFRAIRPSRAWPARATRGSLSLLMVAGDG